MRDLTRTALAAMAMALGLMSVAPADAQPVKPAPKTVKAVAKPVKAVAKPAKATAKPAKAARRAKPKHAAQAAQAWPEDVTQMAQWVIATGDNGGRPFVIIDKVAAKVFVFRADGQLRGAAPALLGAAQGDNSTPGVGDRELSDIAPDDRTTPAGRFVAAFGTAATRKVLWVDYTTAISMHPVVTAHPKERRPQRLKSATPKDNRITYGCINVSDAFYQKVVRRTFTGETGIVYILPETEPLQAVFPYYRTVVASTAPAGDRSAAPASEEPKETAASDVATSAQSAAALAK